MIAAGEPLREPAVAAPDAIVAGQPVAVVWRDANVELRLAGTAPPPPRSARASPSASPTHAPARPPPRRRRRRAGRRARPLTRHSLNPHRADASMPTRSLLAARPSPLPLALTAQARRAPAPAPDAQRACRATRACRCAGPPTAATSLVGDIITVLIDDYTITSAVKDDLASQQRQKDLSLGADVAPPTGPSTTVKAKIGSRNSGDSQDRGEARRENRFQSEMSVRVVAVGAERPRAGQGNAQRDVDKGKQNVDAHRLGARAGRLHRERRRVVAPRRRAARPTSRRARSASRSRGMVGRIVSMVWP